MKYPTGIKRQPNKVIPPSGKDRSRANRGKSLEQRIDVVNSHYKYLNIAQIQFVPTPMRNVPNPRGGTMAVYSEKSTVDFIGTLQGGRSVAFDCKQTKLKTRYDLKYIEPHQMEFLEYTHKMGGAAFFLIEFTALNEIYFLPFASVKEFWAAGDKSIPYSYFKQPVTQGRGVALDYLIYLEGSGTA